MSAYFKVATLLPLLLLLCLDNSAQRFKEVDSLDKRIGELQQLASHESVKMAAKMEEQTAKMQKRVAKYEKKLAKLCKHSDSLLTQVNQLTEKAEPAYWLNKLKAKDSVLAVLGTGPYISRLDSLSGMLNFLDNNGDAGEALESIKAMKARLGITQEYQHLLDEKLSQWKQLLNINGLAGKYLPPSFKKMQTELLAYKAQLSSWKEMLNDQQKLEQEALKWLNKLPAFQRFMQQNGELARLFGGAGGAGNAATSGAPLPGLQTTQSVMGQLQQRFGNGPQALQMVQQQLQQGMSQLSQQQQMMDPIAQLRNQATQLVDKAMQGGTVGNETITPYQKEKAALQAQPLKKRLEFGWNLQTQTRVQGFPAANDLGLNLGYKINPKSVVGVGLAYKFGLGSLQKIQLSHEGLSLRSYVDWRISSPRAKIFANLWLTGGYELNYWNSIASLSQLPELAWQPSGVIGLTKTIDLKKRKMKLQVLYELTGKLSQPWMFRWGTNF